MTGAELTAWREERGLSTQELSYALGLSREEVERIEGLEGKIPIWIRATIAAYDPVW